MTDRPGGLGAGVVEVALGHVVVRGDREHLARLLGALPRAEPASGAPEIVVTIEREAARAPFVTRAPRDFFAGPYDGTCDDDGWTLRGPAGTVRATRDGARVTARVHDAAAADEPAFAAAMRFAFCLGARAHGLFHLHAATLVVGDATLLVAGPSGAGKSTLAIGLLEAAFARGAPAAWLGDDAVFVRATPGESGFDLVALPSAFHVSAWTAARFPRVAARLGGPAVPGKSVLDPAAAWPGGQRVQAPRPSCIFVLGLPVEVGPSPHAAFVLPTAGGVLLYREYDLSPARALGALFEAGALLSIPGAPRVDESASLLARMVSGARCRALRSEDEERAPPT